MFNLRGPTKQPLCSNRDLHEAKSWHTTAKTSPGLRLGNCVCMCSPLMYQGLHAVSNVYHICKCACLSWYEFSFVIFFYFPQTKRWESDKRATKFRGSFHLICTCVSAPRRQRHCRATDWVEACTGWTPVSTLKETVWCVYIVEVLLSFSITWT